jgi:hypothetical protein
MKTTLLVQRLEILCLHGGKVPFVLCVMESVCLCMVTPYDSSLLTGELRAATVSASDAAAAHDCYVLEVSQTGLQPVLARR